MPIMLVLAMEYLGVRGCAAPVNGSSLQCSSGWTEAASPIASFSARTAGGAVSMSEVVWSTVV